MKKILITLITGLTLSVGISVSAQAIESLRGSNALDKDAEMFEKRKQVKQKGGFERSYKIQPPMIPHATDKDKITLKSNTCMKCHSKKNHKKEKAPMIGETHFKDRDGKVLPELSSRRYFCNQCHATQVNAEQLVENNFVGAK